MKSIVGIFKGFTRKSAVEGIIPQESQVPIPKEVYRDLRRDAAKASLTKMLTSGWFDICTVRKIIEANKLIMGPEQHEALSVLEQLHCVHYRDMSRSVYNSLPSLLGVIMNAHSAETMFDEEESEPVVSTATVSNLLEHKGERS